MRAGALGRKAAWCGKNIMISLYALLPSPGGGLAGRQVTLLLWDAPEGGEPEKVTMAEERGVWTAEVELLS